MTTDRAKSMQRICAHLHTPSNGAPSCVLRGYMSSDRPPEQRRQPSFRWIFPPPVSSSLFLSPPLYICCWCCTSKRERERASLTEPRDLSHQWEMMSGFFSAVLRKDDNTLLGGKSKFKCRDTSRKLSIKLYNLQATTSAAFLLFTFLSKKPTEGQHPWFWRRVESAKIFQSPQTMQLMPAMASLYRNNDKQAKKKTNKAESSQRDPKAEETLRASPL